MHELAHVHLHFPRRGKHHLELEIEEPISTFVFSRKDWETKHRITPLYRNIEQDGIRLS